MRFMSLKLFVLTLILSCGLHAISQAPQGINYQAVVLNFNGQVIANYLGYKR